MAHCDTPTLGEAVARMRKAVGISAQTLRELLREALIAQFKLGTDGGQPWIEDIFGDVVVYRDGEKLMQVGFVLVDGVVQLGAEPVQVVHAYVPLTEALAQEAQKAAPSEGAAVAGPKRNFQGIDIVIDRPAGFVQRGRDAAGQEWERTYTTDYGFIPGTRGGDGEGLDVFIGANADAARAYWAVQAKADGNFDEYKLMLGFDDEAASRKCYTDHIPERLLKGIAETSVGVVKALLGIEPTEVMKRVIATLMGECFDLSLFGPSLAAPTQKGAPAGPSLDVRLLPVQKAAADEQRFILGIVLVPDTVDAQGDTYDADTVRVTAHDWMERFRNLDLQHKVFINGLAMPVESYIAPVDFELGGQAVKAGTWMLGVHVIDDTLWAKVKAGEFTGFSINGFAKKTPLGAAA